MTDDDYITVGWGEHAERITVKEYVKRNNENIRSQGFPRYISLPAELYKKLMDFSEFEKE